jgi:hypothetical protein
MARFGIERDGGNTEVGVSAFLDAAISIRVDAGFY